MKFINLEALRVRPKEELTTMREIFTSRRLKIHKIYSNVKVSGARDPNIQTRIRLGRVLQHCDVTKNIINIILKDIKPREVSRYKSKRNRTMERVLLNRAELMQSILLKRPEDSKLPKILIGNAVLYELPFAELINYKDHSRLKVFV
jgi:hypothetical protein